MIVDSAPARVKPQRFVKEAQIQIDSQTCAQTHTDMKTTQTKTTHKHTDVKTQTQTQTNAYGQARRQINSQTQTHKHKHSYTNAHIFTYALKQKHRDTLAEEHIQKHAHVKHLFRRQQ
jgi:hypothetical protein